MSELPKRKNIRYKGYDYSNPGAYFITICTRDMEHIFGVVVDGIMLLNPKGKAAEQELNNMTNHYGDDVEIVNSVVMPNHIHLIICIYDKLISTKDAPENKHPKIGTIVGRYKTNVTKILGFSPWQDRFNDRCIRDMTEYNYKMVYIENNPRKWWERVSRGEEPEI